MDITEAFAVSWDQIKRDYWLDHATANTRNFTTDGRWTYGAFGGHLVPDWYYETPISVRYFLSCGGWK